MIFFQTFYSSLIKNDFLLAFLEDFASLSG